MKKIMLLLALAAAGGYWFLLSRPARYYDKSFEYKNFTLRAHGELPAKPEAVLESAYAKISASELFNQEAKFEIYLPGGRKEFLFFTPLQKGDCSRVNPFTGAIFIPKANFAADKACDGGEYHALSGEISRAAAREMARRLVKPLVYLVMREWKLRGYAERVSGGTGAFTPADICAGKAAAPALLDYKYGLAVELAMREDNLSFLELLNKDYSYEVVEQRLKTYNCPK